MRTLAGPDASVAFTHLSSAAAAALTTDLPSTSAVPEPKPARVACHEEGVLALMQTQGIAQDRVCLLDTKAPLTLSPSNDGFTWFLFGVRALQYASTCFKPLPLFNGAAARRLYAPSPDTSLLLVRQQLQVSCKQ